MTFLASSNQNNYSFVEYIAQTPVKEPGSLRKAGALDVTLDPDAAPIAGEYVFVPKDPDTVFTEFSGPEDSHKPGTTRRRRRLGWPKPGRDKTKQDNFRMRLLSRDGFCLYDEEVDPLECYAAHIVPQNRDDVYTEITGNNDQFQGFSWSPSLLLLASTFRYLFVAYVLQGG
ncbi:hypothetical protein JCM5296_001700 [Sporobolomyces johnsonii]